MTPPIELHIRGLARKFTNFTSLRPVFSNYLVVLLFQWLEKALIPFSLIVPPAFLYLFSLDIPRRGFLVARYFLCALLCKSVLPSTEPF